MRPLCCNVFVKSEIGKCVLMIWYETRERERECVCVWVGVCGCVGGWVGVREREKKMLSF